MASEAQHASVSRMKSREATASMLFGLTRENPSVWASFSLSIAKPAPASAPLPRGRLSAPSSALTNRFFSRSRENRNDSQ
jgi:hypothetical protein